MDATTSRTLPWLALGCALLLGNAVSAELNCVDVSMPEPPAVALKPLVDRAHERPLHGFDRALRMGVGHLRPAGAADRDDWMHHILMPLSATPGAPPAVWLSGGWIVPVGAGALRKAGTRGTIETGYETVSLIVLEINDAGWLRIRFAPGSEDAGTGWVHRCHLEMLRPRLAYEPWEAFLAGSDISPLYFRTGGPRALRRLPEPGAELVAWIPAGASRYALEPLELQGDWMRVRMKAPYDYCAELNMKPAVHEGWVRWRDTRFGPLVWYYTRGC
jgi:hypothetical protein